MAIPNLDIYTSAEITELKTAVKAERLRRLTGEAITQGSKNGRSYSLERMSEAELCNLENAIAGNLGVSSRPMKRRINFNNCER